MQKSLDNLIALLDLEDLEVNTFRGRCTEGWQRVFGGQVLARAIFHLEASFQRAESGPEHHDQMPDVPDPESLPSWRERMAPPASRPEFVEKLASRTPDRLKYWLARDRPIDIRHISPAYPIKEPRQVTKELHNVTRAPSQPTMTQPPGQRVHPADQRVHQEGSVELTTITIALALLEYTVFTMLCGRARARCGIVAPATSGDPTFERYFRVQQNSVEQLIIFVPAMLLFGHYVSAPTGAGLGLVFILGRALFARGYYRDAPKRAIGFGLSLLSNLVLLLGGLIGAVVAYF